MARNLPESERLELALAAYRMGLSPNECEKKYFINYKKVAREARKRGYTKGDLSSLTQELVRVREEIVQLPGQQQDTIGQEADRILNAKLFYANSARKVANIALSSLASDATPANAKAAMDVLHKGLVVESVVPYYPSAATINNTNAQQNIVELTAFQNRPAIKINEQS